MLKTFNIQGGHLLQSALQLGGDAEGGKQVREKMKAKSGSEDKISNIKMRVEEHVG